MVKCNGHVDSGGLVSASISLRGISAVTRIWVSITVAAIMLSTGASATASRVVGLTPEVLARQAVLRGFALSPDGAQAAYLLCDSNSIRRRGCSMRVWDEATGRTDRITPDGLNADSDAAWSPDGRTLAFYGSSGGKRGVWIWERGSAAAREAGHSPGCEAGAFGKWETVAWTADGKHIAFKCKHVSAVAEAVDSRSQADVTVLSTVGLDSADELDQPVEQFRIGIIEWSSGQVRIIPVAISDYYMQFAPDGLHVAFLTLESSRTRNRDTGMPSSSDRSNLVVIDLNSGRSRVVARDIVILGRRGLTWSPDGRWIAYISGDRPVLRLPMGYAGEGDIHLADATGASQPVVLTGEPVGGPGFPHRKSSLAWSADSQSLYVATDQMVWHGDVASGRMTRLMAPAMITPEQIVVATTGQNMAWQPRGREELYLVATNLVSKDCEVYRLSTVGSPPELLYKGREYWTGAAVGVANGSKLLFRRESVYQVPDLWLAERDFGRIRRITQVSPDIDARELGRNHVIEFMSAHGELLRAALLFPPGYREGRSYPMVVWPYPGARGSYTANRFGMTGGLGYNYQLLASQGYVVMAPDVPINPGTMMRDIASAVLPAVNQVVALGIADPDRLAVMGSSGGGYSTISLLAQTGRFKAGIMNAGFADVSNLHGYLYPAGDARFMPLSETYKHRMGVPPSINPLLYVNNSPMYFLDKVTTPLLIQAGKNDQVFFMQSGQVYTELARLGKEVTFLQYGGEGHFVGGEANFLDYWARVTRFLSEKIGADRPIPVDGDAPTR